MLRDSWIGIHYTQCEDNLIICLLDVHFETDEFLAWSSSLQANWTQLCTVSWPIVTSFTWPGKV